MDPRFRSRLIAALILIAVVCSAFSVSPVTGFRLENRDGSGAEAALAEALVLQQSTKIREEFMEDLTVYIDSNNAVFKQQDASGSSTSGLYVPGENAIYIRSDRDPARADEVFVQQVGYRVYRTMGFDESMVFETLEINSGSYLSRVSAPPGEEWKAALFAEAFMLYHVSPALLKADAPEVYTYMDLLVTSSGDRATVDDLYTHYQPE
ncbi:MULTISPECIES: hypothetical protein [unclassified Methanoculleus]|uniref:hypothetical protein n=1 Tax=unclassified Methanoculleus TaxID=2619537 RepID=UPI0025DCD05D|nr:MULTISPECIES: hypothetical protein [unclassified Methanoculleus]MCK9317913.1 hypothetical protein [Methanoculleus sp.]MDD2253703.1 hypothetical protein [Methanoculleus sp.]MDD2788020.1 hypothetical protein [Methanoculleus sp.]MDD3216976.1 hypothetical protein [Methanoculleus sp.]MDD4314496.1 hypothetical protein [Methanoculleus sp.]